MEKDLSREPSPELRLTATADASRVRRAMCVYQRFIFEGA